MTRKNLLLSVLMVFIILFIGTSAVGAQGTADGSVATIQIDSEAIVWVLRDGSDPVILTISGPDGFYEEAKFSAGEKITFSLLDSNNQPRFDGGYNYELSTRPIIDSQVQEALNTVTEENRYAVEEQLRNAGKLPEVRTQSGYFTINQGRVITSDQDELLTNKDQQILDDLIVVGSACVGQDCVNGENFGFDTLRLKENNLRIKAQDTSTSASFPTVDWQLTFNDSTNGGLNKFSVESIDNGAVPFTIQYGASSNSLYVDNAGQIGLGTSNPVVNAHIVEGNTPTVRLEQDGSSGFTPQTWDVAGNEAGFFIRDATNGSKLPFRILPGASSQAFVIAGNDEIGIGAGTNPAAKFHIENTGGDDVDDFVVTADGQVGIGTTEPTEALDVNEGNIKITNTTEPSLILQTLSQNAVDSGKISFVNGSIEQFSIQYEASSDYLHFDTYNTDNALVIKRATGRVGIGTISPTGPFEVKSGGTSLLLLDSNGNLTIPGNLTSANYFKTSTNVDNSNQILTKDAQIVALEQKNAELESRLAALEQLVNSLVKSGETVVPTTE